MDKMKKVRFIFNLYRSSNWYYIAKDFKKDILRE